jgi:hypothetical protein
MANRRIIAVYVRENEHYAALREIEMPEGVSTDSFVIGEVDESSLDVRIDRKHVAKETRQVSQQQCHLSIPFRFRIVKAR